MPLHLFRNITTSEKIHSLQIPIIITVTVICIYAKYLQIHNYRKRYRYIYNIHYLQIKKERKGKKGWRKGVGERKDIRRKTIP